MHAHRGRAAHAAQLVAAIIGTIACSPPAFAGPAPKSYSEWFNAGRPARPSGVSSPSAPAGDPGSLMVFATLDDFLAATDGLPISLEDFAGGFTPAAGVRSCYQALNSTSDDSCFTKGQLVPGFNVRPSRGSINYSRLAALGPAVIGTAGTVVGADAFDPPSNPTRIDFDEAVTAVSMDVYDGQTGGPVSVTAYDADDAVIGAVTVNTGSPSTSAFVGFTSPIAIHRVDVNATSDNSAELIGNLRFGGGAGRLEATIAAPDFGVVTPGQSRTATATVFNSGYLPITVGSVAALTSPFSIASDACSSVTLPPAQTCTIDVSFHPTYASRFEATLNVPSVGAPPATLDLSGQGVSPRVLTMPLSTDFGSIPVGGSSTAQTVKLANLTGSPVTVSSISAASSPFTAVGGDCSAPPFELAPGAQCALEFSFAPTATGDFRAAITITSDTAAPVTARLHGVGGAQ